mmetsp:Transcript_17541/g.34267  ORF Transcript_17541/g.34267 Transcript_17541/m.34267 type:complete len:234 (+) Transcript_17541:199-900(+)
MWTHASLILFVSLLALASIWMIVTSVLLGSFITFVALKGETKRINSSYAEEMRFLRNVAERERVSFIKEVESLKDAANRNMATFVTEFKSLKSAVRRLSEDQRAAADDRREHIVQHTDESVVILEAWHRAVQLQEKHKLQREEAIALHEIRLFLGNSCPTGWIEATEVAGYTLMGRPRESHANVTEGSPRIARGSRYTTIYKVRQGGDTIDIHHPEAIISVFVCKFDAAHNES